MPGPEAHVLYVGVLAKLQIRYKPMQKTTLICGFCGSPITDNVYARQGRFGHHAPARWGVERTTTDSGYCGRERTAWRTAAIAMAQKFEYSPPDTIYMVSGGR
jgi:hypothetical protein